MLFIALLGRVDPFTSLTNRLTDGGATVRYHLAPAPLTTATDVRTVLAAIPGPAAGERRVLVLGNSQQYTSSLPRGTQVDPAHRPAVAYERLGEHLRTTTAGRYTILSAALPNQNFAEALRQGLYWFRLAPERPSILVVQSSFDTYRKTGIRASLTELLRDDRFARLVSAELGAHERSYSGAFRKAISDVAERRREVEGAAARQWSPEPLLRSGLEHLPLFARRQDLRASMLNLLYMARVRVLNIRPTSRRHITGAPLQENFEALEDLLAMARAAGTDVFVYNAPVNPAVDMFYPEENAQHLERLRALCRRYGARFADFTTAVPAEHWGYWIDGPDPIHFDARGHEQMASLLAPELDALINARP